MTDAATLNKGPLAGVRIVEFAGIGPAPFACMLLSDLGAEIVRIDRADASPVAREDIVNRGRTTVLLDLKSPDGVRDAMELLQSAQVLIEGFRPGVMERLGLGPEQVRQRNPGLVYGRMTGWGQTGPLAKAAGHDINYIAIAGALAAVGEPGGAPLPPLNLVGDYGGGALYLVMGVLAALLHARTTGLGQVVDAAICDGTLSLMSSNQTHRLRGEFQDKRGANLLDGGAPYYTTYETRDGLHVSVGAIEPKFFQLLCRQLELPEELSAAQDEPASWPALRAAMAAAFRQRTRAEWSRRLEGFDNCFAPILTLAEARDHPHIRARGGFVDIEGVTHIAPAPRLSRTPSSIQAPAGALPVSKDAILSRWSRRRSG